MSPERVWIKGEYNLEAELWQADVELGVVLAHPHPLFGGDMWFPLLGILAEKSQDKGVTALRFNFRGTGMSEGRYSGGQGEVKDLESAIKFLLDIGVKRVAPIGYSFGAFVVMKWLEAKRADGKWVAIAPPINFMKHPTQDELSGNGLIICGTRDVFSPASKVLHKYNRYKFAKIEGADHLFSGFEGLVADKVLEFLKSDEDSRNE